MENADWETRARGMIIRIEELVRINDELRKEKAGYDEQIAFLKNWQDEAEDLISSCWAEVDVLRAALLDIASSCDVCVSEDAQKLAATARKALGS
jgi:hypothetical protein